jgi:Tfp pilus assembly protein FimT
LEAIIVVGILAAIVAIVLPQFFTILQQYRSETAVEQVVMNLRFARLAAVKKRIPYRVVFQPTPINAYEVQMNPSKDSTTWIEYANADTSIPAGLNILAGGVSDIIYNPRGAATITGGSTVRIHSSQFTYRIDVFTNGAVTKTLE